MSTIVKPRKRQLRGPRYRQERRHLRRGTWFKWKTDRLSVEIQRARRKLEDFTNSMDGLKIGNVIWDEVQHFKASDFDSIVVPNEPPKITTTEEYAAKRAELGIDIDRDTANASLATIGLSPLPEIPTITIETQPRVCKTCGATGDDPCMTKSGKVATKEHSGRRVL